MIFIEERNSRTATVLWVANAFELKCHLEVDLCCKTTHTSSQFYSCALVAANYCFIAVDVAAVGKSRNSSVFKNSNTERKLESNQLGIPGRRPLPNDINGKRMPFVIVGDEAFALQNMYYGPTYILHRAESFLRS
jgi:hypothetical protein